MKSITIHGLDPLLAEGLRRRARENGLSLNKTIKNLLASALGIQPPAPNNNRRQRFEDLCGIWTKREASAFHDAVKTFERVDAEDWK